MSVKWIVREDEPKHLKEFLKYKGVSRRIIGRTKFHGGSFEVNGEEVWVREELETNDQVQLNLPVEEGNVRLNASDKELDIIYEDEHYLIINKPNGILSVPSPDNRTNTIANRVKGYFVRNNYRHQVVHIITRLDLYTTGVMIVGKNTLAHSFIAKALEKKTIDKYYETIVEGSLEKKEGFISQPIARSSDSIIERVVSREGKESITEYKVLSELSNNLSHVAVSLHTGRTHQIRVHMAHIGHPIIGDELYGASTKGIGRQALHCKKIAFTHPFTNEKVNFEAELPRDMKNIIKK
ncbi:MAG: RluA family pseudouridine synthase [Atopostipes sp.]|nr:RluA family pseudouridine synthase [Atopostipes sp.]